MLLIARRGARPLLCVSDNGTELTSTAILSWSQQSKTGWHYIAPGKPQRRGADRYELREQTIRTGDDEVLTLLLIEDDRML